MILNTGSRTDIPAFFSDWLMNRVRAGFVMARNPFNARQVTRYRLDPRIVDVMTFCTKNPRPMLKHLTALAAFRTFWFVTITPYGREIEPGVPDKMRVMADFAALSKIVGRKAVHWRYDPIFISEKYTVAYHLRAFAQMAHLLAPYTDVCIISFIDLYRKTRRQFPEVREVTPEERIILGRKMAAITRENGMLLRTCSEGTQLMNDGVDTGGCMTRHILEKACGIHLQVPGGKAAATRTGCDCLLGADIGAYNTCGHGCRYCYANSDARTVARNRACHDPGSPLLVGRPYPEDQIHEADQRSWTDGQIRMAF